MSSTPLSKSWTLAKHKRSDVGEQFDERAEEAGAANSTSVEDPPLRASCPGASNQRAVGERVTVCGHIKNSSSRKTGEDRGMALFKLVVETGKEFAIAGGIRPTLSHVMLFIYSLLKSNHAHRDEAILGGSDITVLREILTSICFRLEPNIGLGRELKSCAMRHARRDRVPKR
ncbi:hypothetical protein BDZ89DRAFT_1113842 [Hymenopellis radicata]|nr:hypothetical protein BDZ89DRAFT_1113842 [Hymenopellis radicata]